MAWIYLAESEESQKPWMATCGLSPIVKTTDTHNLSFYRGWVAAIYPLPHFGMTYAHSGDQFSHINQKLFMADSLAKTLALQDAEKAWQESEAAFFQRSFASLARYDRDSSSWKMSQLFVHGEETLLPDDWPASGMTVDGTLYPLQTWERTTDENDGGFWPTPDTISGGPSLTGNKVRPSGTKAQIRLNTAVLHPHLWPTPTARDGRNPFGDNSEAFQLKKEDPRGVNLVEELQRRNNGVGGQLNPTWVEWLMGYPSEWTALEPWAIAWFRPKRGKRLKG